MTLGLQRVNIIPYPTHGGMEMEMEAKHTSLISKEHYELLNEFEKTFSHLRFDKEEKTLWSQGYIYQNGEANQLFLAYRHGFSFGKAVA